MRGDYGGDEDSGGSGQGRNSHARASTRDPLGGVLRDIRWQSGWWSITTCQVFLPCRETEDDVFLCLSLVDDEGGSGGGGARQMQFDFSYQSNQTQLIRGEGGRLTQSRRYK